MPVQSDISDIPIFMESFSKYFSISSFNLKQLDTPEIELLTDTGSLLDYSKEDNILKTRVDIYTEFSKEFNLLASWIGYLNSKVQESGLIVNIAFCFVYESIKEHNERWLDLWKKIELTQGNEILTHALWKKREYSETLSEDLVNLIKISNNLNLLLSKNTVIKYLENSMLEKLEDPDESLTELIGLILTQQTDNAKELTKKLKINIQSYTTVTRKLQTIYDKNLINKRSLPVLYKFGFVTTHVIISCSQQEYRIEDSPTNPWLFSFIKGYGTNFYKSFVFVTPNTKKANEFWTRFALKYKHNENILIMQKYKEMTRYFSKEFWIDNHEDWSFLNYVLNDLALYLKTSFISDQTLETEGIKIIPEEFTSSKGDLLTLNAMILHATINAKTLASTTGETVTKVRERLSKFRTENKIKDYFFPGYKILPELIYLVINTDLVPYDNLRKFLAYLPFVGEETCIEIHSGSAWRLIYFYTKIGKTDDIINSIVMNFPLEKVFIIRPQLRLGSYWQVPIDLFEKQARGWNYNWDDISKELGL